MLARSGLWLWIVAAGAVWAQETPVPVSGPLPQAPPPSWPIQTRVAPTVSVRPLGRAPQTLYSIGQPTDEEQLYLEYINRSRANPAAEGVLLASTTDPGVLGAYAYFNVDLALMQYEFSTNVPVPPLAMNAQLTAAARWHSGDMFTNQYQGHYQTNGADVLSPADRLAAVGYNWVAVGENVYSTSESVFFGHAGFDVDWGPGPSGMQDPPGHRLNMHSYDFVEIGVGVVDGVNGSVGPQLVTEDFGTQTSPFPFITGVVYYDFNQNSFYDLGEGIRGVTVSVPDSDYYAVTADSGGYAVPVTTNGTYTVSFSASGLSTQTVAEVSWGDNVKVDFVPAFSPPAISGPVPAYQNQNNAYTFAAVGAATAYQWQQAMLISYSAVEGAENGHTNVTIMSSPGYTARVSDVKASGSYSYHLAQPDLTAQYLTLHPILRPNTNSQLTFAKRLGYSTTSQVARAQVTTNSGDSWLDVWSQAGTNGSGETAFARVTNSLAAFAGQVLQVRFIYDNTATSGYTNTISGVGLYLDDMAVSNAEQLTNVVTADVSSGTALSFLPMTLTNYLLRVRAQISSRTLSWGPPLRLNVVPPPPVIQFTNLPVLSGAQLQLDFTVANYRSNMTFQLWKAPTPSDLWAQDTTATLQTLVASNRYRFTSPIGSASKACYRVRGSY
jgi:hypothetical protein